MKNIGRLRDSDWTIERPKALSEMREARRAGARRGEVWDVTIHRGVWGIAQIRFSSFKSFK